MPLVKCSHCNKDLERFQCLIDRNKSGLWFCDKRCKDSFYIAQNTHTCASCGKAIYIKPYRLNRLKVANGVACSRECRRALLGWVSSRAIECDQCGKRIKRRGSHVKDHNFCSRTCMGQWQSENMVGKNSPTWQGGYESYYGLSWEKQRRAAYIRDNATCQACGITEGDAGYTLDVHHKRPFRLCRDHIYANDLRNLTTLCHDCHRKAETYARWLFNPLRRKAQPDHPLKNHRAILRVYFHTKTKTP